MRRWPSLLSLLLASSSSVACLVPAGSVLSDHPRDSVISANVEAQLAQDQSDGLSGILVSTEDGTVILAGTVSRAERKARAAELARQVKGVKRVKNDLQIDANSSQ